MARADSISWPRNRREHVEHRLRVAAGRGQVAQAGLVGARLLGAAVRQRAALRRLARAGGDGDARLRAAADRRRRGPEHADDRDAARALQLQAAPGDVPAGDVAGLVGDDRPELVDGLELGQHAGVQEHPFCPPATKAFGSRSFTM